MIKHHARVFIMLGILIAMLLLSQSSVAQNHWLRPVDETSVSLDIFKPKFDDNSAFNLFTTVMFYSAYIPATDNLTLVVEFPVANADTDVFNETQFGNPYFGVEYKLPNTDATRAFVGRFGIRPPIASDKKQAAGSIGVVTTYDRFEAFLPDLTTLALGGGVRLTPDNGFAVDADVNGNLMIASDADNELFIDYSVAAWMVGENIQGGLGFTGRWLMTESDLSFGEATVHQIGVFANYDLGKFQPGVHFRVPLDDDLSDIVNFTYGVNLTVEFE